MGKYHLQSLSYKPKFGNAGGWYPLPKEYNTICPVCKKTFGNALFKDGCVKAEHIHENKPHKIWFLCHSKCKRKIT